MSTDTTNTTMTYDHTENKRLYCQDWIETDRPWERWECLYGGCSAWMSLVDHPDWSAATQYRRIDQHRKLQEIAKDPTKQIKVKGSDIWYDAGAWYWSELPENYEIRDKPTEKTPVKYLCYENGFGSLMWRREGIIADRSQRRVPELDKEVTA